MALTFVGKKLFLVGLLFLSFLTSNVPTTSAHVGTMTSLGTDNPPTIDGTIEAAEWADATVYSWEGDPIGICYHFMHDNEFIYVGIRAESEENIASLSIYFDEGDDGSFGSGSHDGLLMDNQEDKKHCGYASYDTENVKPIKLDGYYGSWNGISSSWNTWASQEEEIDFDASFAFHQTHWDFEFKIPLHGTEGKADDPSDLTVTTLDSVGVLLVFSEISYSEVSHNYVPCTYTYRPGSDLLVDVYKHNDPTEWLDLVFDSDTDGLPDPEEDNLGTSLYDPDTDGDNLLDGEEAENYKTDPLNPDNDNDGLKDGEEVKVYSTNPLKLDTDNDGLADNVEIFTYSTDPLKLDTDDDGLADNEEILTHTTDPLKSDTDDDGLNDGGEITRGSNPFDSDTDDDGIKDGEEVNRGTNLFNADTDGDSWSDSTDPWPTNAFLPNVLIILFVVVCVVGIIWWRRRR